MDATLRYYIKGATSPFFRKKSAFNSMSDKYCFEKWISKSLFPIGDERSLSYVKEN
jgi:hypothetical protein